MLVKDRMTPNPIVLRVGSDPLAGIAICKSGGFCRLPVVDEEGRLVGIVTEGDLQLFLSQSRSPGVMRRQHQVEQVMRSPVISVPPDYPLEEAARLMLQHDIGGLPVVDSTGRPVGIITRSDIFAQFTEALGADTTALRVTVRVPDQPGELAKLAGRIAGIGGNICSVVSHRPAKGESLDLTLRVDRVAREGLLEAIRADPAVEVLYTWEPGTEEEMGVGPA
jgi:acetoin utilization protein AcuB